MKSPIVLLREVLADASLLIPDVGSLDKDLRTLSRRFKDEGYGFLAVALPELCKALDRGLADGRFVCPRNFRRVPRGAIPRLFSGMFYKVFDSQGNLLQERRTDVVRMLRSILLMWKKVDFSSDLDERLDQKAKATFIETDNAIRDTSYDESRVALYRRVCNQVLHALHYVDYEDILCKHGPGAVSEKLTPNQKWSEVVVQALSEEEKARRVGLGGFLESVASAADFAGLPSSLLRDCRASGEARLVSVRKDSRSRRSITVEPLLNQFYQQGLNVVLRDSIEKDRVLNRCLALTRQELNQHLALEGSRTGLWSTLDLKSASDLLSLKLVEITFTPHLNFLFRLMEARTSVVNVDGYDVFLSKFAGMGNATTFPVQSVVFALLAITAIHDEWGITPTRESMKRAADCIQVYGDDIIVLTEYSSQVVDWVESFGLRVNWTKSFTVGNFRESCGVDAWCGEDVTPYYLRRRPDTPRLDADAVSNLVSVAGSFRLSGMYKTSELIYRTVEKALGRALPYGRLDSGYICRVSVLGYSTAEKWCNRLQRFLVKAPVIRSNLRKDPIDGYPALLKFFLVPLLGRGKNHLESSERRFSSRIVWRWVPL